MYKSTLLIIVCVSMNFNSEAFAFNTQSDSQRIVNEASQTQSEINDHLSSITAEQLNQESRKIDEIYAILNQKYSDKGEGSAPTRLHYLSLP